MACRVILEPSASCEIDLDEHPPALRRVPLFVPRVYRLRSRMARLINAKFSSARQSKSRDQAPAKILDRFTPDPMLAHLCNEPGNVVAHQIKFMEVVLFGRMHCDLGGRESEDQPAMADIHVGQLQHVTQKGAIRFRIGAVNN
jgi:hypothetical protein